MKNVFKDAYFGKAYRTRDGRKAIYNYHSSEGYHDIIIDDEGMSYHFADHTNGILNLPISEECKNDVDYSSPIDIVSEWQEEINEEELGKLALECVDNNEKNSHSLIYRDKMKETIISAAVHFDDGKDYIFQKCYGIKTGFVIGTFRHPMVHGILALNPKYKKDDFPLSCNDYKVYQGFITSLGRFVDRKEAYNIAVNSGQVRPEDCYGTELYSEDLFPEQIYNDKCVDIVSEWQEEINEEELEKLAEEEYPYEYNTSLYGNEECEYKNELREAFKAGYRKAKE